MVGLSTAESASCLRLLRSAPGRPSASVDLRPTAAAGDERSAKRRSRPVTDAVLSTRNPHDRGTRQNGVVDALTSVATTREVQGRPYVHARPGMPAGLLNNRPRGALKGIPLPPRRIPDVPSCLIGDERSSASPSRRTPPCAKKTPTTTERPSAYPLSEAKDASAALLRVGARWPSADRREHPDSHELMAPGALTGLAHPWTEAGAPARIRCTPRLGLASTRARPQFLYATSHPPTPPPSSEAPRNWGWPYGGT